MEPTRLLEGNWFQMQSTNIRAMLHGGARCPRRMFPRRRLTFGGKSSRVFQGKGGYLVGYVIPGPNGLEPGHRLYNWVWYSLLPHSSLAFKESMTDIDNVVHRSTLPIGKMRPEIWERQVSYANKTFQPPASFLELINKTTQPFISTVGDISSSQACFFDNKLVLVGEALNLLRPQMGMSFNQSAVHTLALERVFKGEEKYGMKEWEREVLTWGEKTKWKVISFARYWLSGLLGVNFWAALIRYTWVIVKQRAMGIWWKNFRRRVGWAGGERRSAEEEKIRNSLS